MRAGASRPAKQRDGPAFVEQIGQTLEISLAGHDDRGSSASGWRQLECGASTACCSATSPGITITETPRLPIASRIATSTYAASASRPTQARSSGCIP